MDRRQVGHDQDDDNVMVGDDALTPAEGKSGGTAQVDARWRNLS